MILNLIVSVALVVFGLREYRFVREAAEAGHHPLWTYVGHGQVALYALALLAVWL